MKTHKIKFRIAYLYFFLLAIALLYGAGLVRSAYNFREADFEYSKIEIILKKNALRLVLRDGYITMHYGKMRLTENSGLACFFIAKGIEYATFKARWKIEKISSEELLAVTTWPGLPIKQIWHLWLKDGKLGWQVDLESNEEIVVKNIGVVFFFRANYQEWASYYEQGRMPVLNILQQRKDVSTQGSLNAVAISATGKEARLFPAVGLSLGKGVLLNKVWLSSCRDMFSKDVFSSISVGGLGPLRVLKNRKVYLSSGEINLFDKKDDLSGYFRIK